uniref:WRKY domain-containing protein n=1 Tax=Fagus sylvatica TaxID=28930 RepID=A0A2N9EMU4_FAGSY
MEEIRTEANQGVTLPTARKHVERAPDDPAMLIVTYEAEHSHTAPPPMQENVAAGVESGFELRVPNTHKETMEDMNGDSFQKVKQRFKDRTMKVAQTKEMLSKQAVQTKEILSKQAIKFAKQAEEHERFINKVVFPFLKLKFC